MNSIITSQKGNKMTQQDIKKTESQDIEKIEPQFLLDSGLLFAINHQILHPLGLALEVYCTDKENDLFLITEGKDKNPMKVKMGKVALGQIWDYRDNEEGMTFEEKTFEEGIKKYNEFMNNFGTEKIRTRLEKLGFILQPNPQTKNK